MGEISDLVPDSSSTRRVLGPHRVCSVDASSRLSVGEEAGCGAHARARENRAQGGDNSLVCMMLPCRRLMDWSGGGLVDAGWGVDLRRCVTTGD